MRQRNSRSLGGPSVFATIVNLQMCDRSSRDNPELCSTCLVSSSLLANPSYMAENLAASSSFRDQASTGGGRGEDGELGAAEESLAGRGGDKGSLLADDGVDVVTGVLPAASAASSGGSSAGICMPFCLHRATNATAHTNSFADSLPSAPTSERRQIFDNSFGGTPEDSKKSRASPAPKEPAWLTSSCLKTPR